MHWIVVQVYPLSAMTAFESDDITCLHTCLSVKTYFKFAQDHADSGANQINKPSSDEGDDHGEVKVQVQPLCCSHPHTTPPSTSTHTHHASTLTANSSSGPAVIVATNPLQPGGSFTSLSLLPPKIWDTPWVSSPGCYRGWLLSSQPRAEQAYRLAAGEDHGDGLYLTGQSIATLVDEFKTLLGNAAECGDFMEVLHPNQSFIMWVLYILLRNSITDTTFSERTKQVKQCLFEMALSVK